MQKINLVGSAPKAYPPRVEIPTESTKINYKKGIYSIVVIHSIRIAETAVRF